MRRLIPVLIGFALALDLHAQDPARRVQAVRIPGHQIVIDGKLNESVWKTAEPAAGFTQQQPKEGAPTTEKSEVRFLYDDDNLYVGATLYDDEPQRLIINELKRDFNARDGDLFVLVLDTFHDRRNSYGFQTNPMGAQRDTQSYDDGRNNNQNWDAVWYLKASIFDSGWIVEYAIPFKSLRFSDAEEQAWGVNIFRLIRRKNEITLWSPVPRQFSQFKVSYAGTLEGIRGVKPGRNLRVKPFVTGSASRSAAGTKSDGDGGVDVKVGIGSNMVLDGTYRTDFSQVEADEQQVNLTRFNLFFPEKREFFLENQGTFQMGPPLPNNNNAGAQSSGPPDFLPFFSRTIGLSDTGTPVPIFGGARLTGKVGRNSIGVMNIQTEIEKRRSLPDLPAANLSVIRFAREFLSNSSASVFYLGKERGSVSNRAGGGDLRFNIRRVLDIDGLWMRSAKTGVGGGDASRLGFMFDSTLNRFSASYTALGRNFRDDLGFIPRPGVHIANASAARRIRPALTYKWVREYRAELPYARFTRKGFGVETTTASPTFNIDFADGANFKLTYRFNQEALSTPFRIRSDYSIPVGQYRFGDGNMDYSSSRARRLSVSGALRFGNFWNGTKSGFSAGGRFRYSAKLASSLNYSHDKVDLPGIRFATNLVQLRLDTSFSTRMFLNAYVQYNSVNREVVSNVRFNVIHHPLSDLFVVFNETRSTAHLAPAARAIILKLTHLVSF